MPYIRLHIAVFAPTPTASVSVTTSVNPGRLNSARAAWRVSLQSVSMLRLRSKFKEGTSGHSVCASEQRRAQFSMNGCQPGANGRFRLAYRSLACEPERNRLKSKRRGRLLVLECPGER